MACRKVSAMRIPGSKASGPQGDGYMISNISPCEEAATVDQAAIAAREAGLHQALTRAQVVMIGLGGAIGTGLFMGSGTAIGYAGPAVIVSYAIAGFAARSEERRVGKESGAGRAARSSITR